MPVDVSLQFAVYYCYVQNYPVWHISKIQLHQSMHIYPENNCAKFNSDPIWSDGALGFFKRISPTRRPTTRWFMLWDQFLIQKYGGEGWHAFPTPNLATWFSPSTSVHSSPACCRYLIDTFSKLLLKPVNQYRYLKSVKYKVSVIPILTIFACLTKCPRVLLILVELHEIIN